MGIFSEQWNQWCQRFWLARREPMSERLMDQVINLVAAQGTGLDVPRDVLESPLFKLLTSRADSVGLTIDTHAKAFLLGFCTNPAKVVMVVHALRFLQLQDERPVTVELLGLLRFSMGVPMEESWKTAWEDQRVKGGTLVGANMLDLVGQDDVHLIAA